MPDEMAELWIEPSDLASRDLFYGPGGPGLVPSPETVYRLKGLDTTGHSRGYEVVDPEGRVWDVKIGDEAQSEVVASRILWAIGYHQPVVYFVPKWRMSGGRYDLPEAGRFRLESGVSKEGNWSWHETPFRGTRPFGGLLAVNVLLNNWDLTPTQNRIYRIGRPAAGPERRYVVQDLGATLGRTRWPIGDRNNVESFEKQSFVTGVDEDGRVRFDFHGHRKDAVKGVTADDVVWACRLLDRLTDAQLHDAFRAAQYPKPIADRFVAKIRRKMREGLALERDR